MINVVSAVNHDLFLQTYNLSGKNIFLDYFMIFGAEYLIIIIFLLSIYIGITQTIREKKALLLALIALGIGFFLVKTIGLFIYEPRPFTTYEITPLIHFAPNDAFPSDHTITITILVIAFYYYRSKYTFVYLLALMWTGFSRVYVGVHYPLDIIGGIIFALAATWIALQIKKLIKQKVLF